MLCLSPLAVNAQQPEEMQSISLDSVLVTEHRRSLLLKQQQNGTLQWDMRMMQSMPQILSNADPIHYAQMLPGVQSNNEYQGGIHVQGCDNEHNEISIDGVPIYNVNHLLGFFSTFNATHFKSMQLTESAQKADFPNRIGAQLTMQLYEEQPDTMSGDLSVGLLSSQGTLRMPLNSSSALTVSLRTSYMNLLYGAWLKMDGQQLKYSFYDFNTSYTHHFNQRNMLLVDIYTGMDKADMQEDKYMAHMQEKWGNATCAMHWISHPNDDLSMRTSLYTTSYGNKLQMDMVQEHYWLKSRIVDVGLRHGLEWRGWKVGGEAIWHYIQPQSVGGYGSYKSSFPSTPKTKSVEASLYADKQIHLSPLFDFSVGMRGAFYRAPHRTYWSANPSAEVGYTAPWGRYAFSYALRHQYIFQAGFSDMGLPTEFWFTADKNIPPQYAHCFNVRAEAPLFDKRYQVSVSLYYKKLYHQVEYDGTILDLIGDQYQWDNQLLYGKGENYGANVMVSKCTGRLTGWMSYSYGRARRSYPTAQGWRTYPANHERPHEIKAVATYSLPKHWSFGATFVACSGTPFTAPRAIYVMNGHLMSIYDEHNANRLSPYWRMDVSANYQWKGRHKWHQGVNLSVYNLLFHDNDLFHYVRVSNDGEIYYKAMGFVSPILPSVSYFMKF